jgi:hypothetical protein
MTQLTPEQMMPKYRWVASYMVDPGDGIVSRRHLDLQTEHILEATEELVKAIGLEIFVVGVECLGEVDDGLKSEVRDLGEELDCAEAVLDGYAMRIGLERTHFDCVGDYVTTVCDRLIEMGKLDV